MSSFTIAKREYMKAAGVVAGIADYYNRGPRSFWIYNYTDGRNCTTEDYKKLFASFYIMNAESVAEQYGDAEPETDQGTYEIEFSEATRTATRAIMNGKLKNLMMELRDFFRSALYQTENEESARVMEEAFSRIIDQILDKAFPRETNSWGALDLDSVLI